MLSSQYRAAVLAAVLIVGFGASSFLRQRHGDAQDATELPRSVPAESTRAAAFAAKPDSIARDTTPQRDTSSMPTQSQARYRAGEDPDFAARMGWPVDGPEPLPNAILPERRIVAYYGNPLSKRMGVLGEYAPEEMLRRFERQLDEWRKADPDTPVQPALHLIAVVAQGDAGPTGKYRSIVRDSLIERVYEWARSKDAILFLDIQSGLSDIRELVPKFDKFLARPDVHLGIDPEFLMKSGNRPGSRIGSIDAADINYASNHLAALVREHNLPPKVLVIHRFTRPMVRNARAIKLRPEVQIVMHMDGWGAAWLKRDSYRDYIVREPVQFTGFKLFYHNDTKKGNPLMTPADVLKLRPVPLYIQYQ
ncbi:MAG TPA: hypothetical protein VK864_07695 [Longimicrobiales bacterium]|nr:hypothetical protein [Longimicrobiales bacterium]